MIIIINISINIFKDVKISVVPILNLYSNIKDREMGLEGRDQDIGKGRGRALRVGRKVGDNMWEWTG